MRTFGNLAQALNRAPVYLPGLTQGIANSCTYSQVYTCVALDARNDTLLNCLRTTGLPDLAAGWSSLLNNGSKVRFKVFTHQAWVAHVA